MCHTASFGNAGHVATYDERSLNHPYLVATLLTLAKWPFV